MPWNFIQKIISPWKRAQGQELISQQTPVRDVPENEPDLLRQRYPNLSDEDVDDLAAYVLGGEGWIHLSSTNVGAIKYLWEQEILEVEFQDERYYQYFQVPPEMFLAFLRADSPGRFVWDTFRRGNDHGYVRIGWGGSRPTGDRRIWLE